MIRWIATLTVLLALVGGTALMADAAEWTVIGDGYVPMETVTQAREIEPALVTEGFSTPWFGLEDGYVWKPNAPAADGAALVAGSDCGHEVCSMDTCETERVARWTVIGDGYVPQSTSAAPEMICC